MTDNQKLPEPEFSTSVVNDDYSMDPTKKPLWHLFGGEFVNTDVSPDPFFVTITVGATTNTDEEIIEFLHEEHGEEVAQHLQHLGRFDHEPTEADILAHTPEKFTEDVDDTGDGTQQ